MFVDGYYAGIVDDFDGTFQRLRVTPGQHEIELYLDGYREVRQKVYLPVNDSFKIKYTMERLTAGEQPEARPQPINPPPAPGGPPNYPPPGAVGRGPGRMPATASTTTATAAGERRRRASVGVRDALGARAAG